MNHRKLCLKFRHIFTVSRVSKLKCQKLPASKVAKIEYNSWKFIHKEHIHEEKMTKFNPNNARFKAGLGQKQSNTYTHTKEQHMKKQ